MLYAMECNLEKTLCAGKFVRLQNEGKNCPIWTNFAGSWRLGDNKAWVALGKVLREFDYFVDRICQPNTFPNAILTFLV